MVRRAARRDPATADRSEAVERLPARAQSIYTGVMDQKVVVLRLGTPPHGTDSSTLLPGDPDQQKYGSEALPKLLAEGYNIFFQGNDWNGCTVFTLARSEDGRPVKPMFSPKKK